MEMYLRWKSIIDEEIKFNLITSNNQIASNLYRLKLELMEDFYRNDKITISTKLESQLL